MRPLSQSKHHLSPVGTLHVVTSSTYGSYVMRCVANIDWFPGVDANEYFKWAERYHPKHFAAAYLLVSDPDPGVDSRYSSLFVPLESDNADWYDENRTCQYLQQVKGRRTLPIVLAQKELDRFLANSRKMLVDQIVKLGDNCLIG